MTEYHLGRCSDGGLLAVLLSLLPLLVFAVYTLSTEAAEGTVAGGALWSILGKLLVNSAPIYVPFCLIGFAYGLTSTSSSRLLIDELGWKWISGRKVLASASWAETGGARLRAGLRSKIELLSLDGSMLCQIPVSKRTELGDTLLAEIEGLLPSQKAIEQPHD
jgi:hypothetical protein